eukprot:scaffold65161_cov42-Phaeocystis_antarctica.AAC.1
MHAALAVFVWVVHARHFALHRDHGRLPVLARHSAHGPHAHRHHHTLRRRLAAELLQIERRRLLR